MNTSAELEQMKNYIKAFPQNMRDALDVGSRSILSFTTLPVDKVVIAGLGGSGIGGKIVSQLVWDSCSAPIELVNDYRCPGWVDSRTLFIAVSYSGNTEETLAALSEAIQKGAQISCITAGGSLKDLAWERKYNIIEIPGGQPPRTSFGYNATQLFFILFAYHLIPTGFADDLALAANLLDEEGGLITTEAAAIANKIVNCVPVIYAETRNEGIAQRLRQQINENAKMLCWHHVLPEMNHNELVGWAGGDDSYAVLMLHSPEDEAGTVKRMELTKNIIEGKTKTYIDLNPRGGSRIERAYYLIHLGDWISYFMAAEKGVNPIEIDVIDQFKSALAQK